MTGRAGRAGRGGRADAKRRAARTGSRLVYERGDEVETPLGVGMIDTDPDERGRCMVLADRPLDDGTALFSATTFEFGRIIQKWNGGGKAGHRGRA
jgi:hypothetical protein